MNVKILDISAKSEWKLLLEQLPENQRDIYFTPEFYELAQRNNEGNGRCFVFEHDGDLALYPYAHGSINELGLLDLDKEYYDIQGAYGYNGVISSSYRQEFIDAFYHKLETYCLDNNIITDFTRFHPLLNNEKFSESYMKVSLNRKTVWLDLSEGYEVLWEKHYTSRNRNMIRKAVKNDLTARITSNGEACERFYESYTETMKRLDAYQFYFFSKKYFHDLSELLKGKHCFVEIIYNEEVITSLILFYHGKYAHYHLASRDSSNANLGAGNLALDTAVKFALEKGCEKFFLGGGISRDPKDSLLKFKKSLSKEITDFLIGTKVCNPVVYKKVCAAWEKKFPEKIPLYGNILLKYRT
jgi:hypothetical protein